MATATSTNRLETFLLEKLNGKTLKAGVLVDKTTPDLADGFRKAAETGFSFTIYGAENDVMALDAPRRIAESTEKAAKQLFADASKFDFIFVSAAQIENVRPLMVGPKAGVAVTIPETIGRPLIISDTFCKADPTVNELVSIVEASVETAKKIDIATPNVAMLAAVEVANPGLPVTMNGQEVAQRFEGKEGQNVQGPLSVDLALSEHAAKKKKAKGVVPGKADILVAPNMTVATSITQAICRLAEQPAAMTILCENTNVATPVRSMKAEGAWLSLLLTAAL